MNCLALLPPVKVPNKCWPFSGQTPLHSFGYHARSQRPRQSVQRREFRRPYLDMSTRSRQHQNESDR